MSIKHYITKIKQKFKTSNATEHSYRPAFVLEEYLKSLYDNQILVINEPRRQKCGAPDFTISKKRGNSQIPIGYIDTKDIEKI